MKGTHIGEFEEIVMLAIAGLQEEAYGLAIRRELQRETGRKINLSAVHASCNRLESKGMLSARFGEKSAKRGGKRKKIYSVTLSGQEALYEVNALRQRLWQRIHNTGFQTELS